MTVCLLAFLTRIIIILNGIYWLAFFLWLKVLLHNYFIQRRLSIVFWVIIIIFIDYPIPKMLSWQLYSKNLFCLELVFLRIQMNCLSCSPLIFLTISTSWLGSWFNWWVINIFSKYIFFLLQFVKLYFCYFSNFIKPFIFLRLNINI